MKQNSAAIGYPIFFMKFVSFGSRTNKSDVGCHKFDYLFRSLERTKQKKRIQSNIHLSFFVLTIDGVHHIYLSFFLSR